MIAFILALITQISAPSYLRPGADLEHRTVAVEFIYDGDTFRGEDGTVYRLAGINAPEVEHPDYGKPSGEPGGEEATDALRAMIHGREVTTLIDRANPTDRYGRTVVIVLADELDVNLAMVRTGLAEIRYLDLSPMIDPEQFRREAQEIPAPPAHIPPNPLTMQQTRAGLFSVSQFGMEARETDVTSRPASSSHILAPGDRIRVIVGTQTEDFTINPDGEIFIKGLGIFQAGGLTAAEASAALDTTIRACGVSIESVTVFYLAPPTRTTPNVVILGAVRKPGTYRAATLLGAISTAEGFNIDANPSELRLTVGDSTSTINAARILSGDARDIPLYGNELIVVPSLPRILLSGAVAKPNWVTALYLSEAISAAGGPLPEADLQNVELRNKIDTPQRVNVQAIFSGHADDIRLDDRARITIPIRPKAIVPLVQVYGPVQRPGTTEAFTLADAVRESRPDTTANLEEVILDRAAGESETLNARDIALGHALDHDLKQGDRILIPRHPEAARDSPQTVTVLGDVAKPGQYPPGSLTQLLASAGGPNSTARLSAIHVRNPDGKSSTYDLSLISQGRQLDPALPPNSTLYLESDEPRRQGIADFKTILGIVTAVLLLGSRL